MINEFKKQFPNYDKESNQLEKFDEGMDKNFIKITNSSRLMKNNVASLDF